MYARHASDATQNRRKPSNSRVRGAGRILLAMSRAARNEHPIHDLLKARWSPRAFLDKPVPENAMLSLLEAARWAASSYNEQPWRFIVATKSDPREFQRALECLLPANQAWAKLAPMLILTVAKRTFTLNDSPNRVAVHDVALAMANLTVQATALGLCVHQMAGVDLDKVRATYGVPEGYEPVTGAAVGYEGPAELLPENLREPERAERTRKPLKEWVFTGAWGKPSPLVG